MNREERRKIAKGYNTPQKLNLLEKELRRAIKKEWQEDADRRVRAFIQDYTTLVIYVLWYSFGFGKKRMARFADELKKHLDILENDKKYELTLQDMTDMLRKEADIDLKFLDDGNKIDRKWKRWENERENFKGFWARNRNRNKR